ncbi:MAG: 16S rRNA (cytidine(1402)-2'-O)-methyltransferase [Clostridia bacterium]|nr:16S rRNA (cytidine(1402)-2'-O)-methyltransferase [Clostridia bacterium]
MAKVFFVATPIGNLNDISFRAIETLKSVDVILCEDTRHSKILLDRYEIAKPLKSFHKFNEVKTLDYVCGLVRDGKDVAVISDAGMPCISDPGYLLVQRLLDEGLEYTVIPGACAFVTAFVLSGFEAPFAFAGFLKEKASDRKKQLEGLSGNMVNVFYSAVHNINDDLKTLYEFFGDRKVAVVKEISKMYESVEIFDLKDACLENPKGEFVIVLDKVAQTNALNDLHPKAHVEFYINGGMKKMDAIKQTAKDRGVNKNEIYKLFVD